MHLRDLEEGKPKWTPKRAAFPRIVKVLTKLPGFILRRIGAENVPLIVCMVVWFLWYSFTILNSRLGHEQQLACTSVHWTNAHQCGLNGDNCRPFTGESLPFRCPADCQGAQITAPVTVGGDEYNYRPLVIGGTIDESSPPSYRGDSFICAAAIHAGAIPKEGGCGVLLRLGETSHFPSTTENGIESIGFNSSFPLTISFDMTVEAGNSVCSSGDPRWVLLIATMFLCSMLPLLMRSTTHFFGTVFTIVFFHVALVSDPPDEPHMQRLDSVISAAVGTFLPAAFVAFVLFHVWIRYTLPVKLCSTRTWLWLWATWGGSLCNVAEQLIPLQRLTARDMHQPGAVPATAYIIMIVIFCAADQIRIHSKEGTLARYLTFYVLAMILVCAAANLPGFQFRAHHYAWALILIPGASKTTWRASVYQGLLLGIFINGVARCGFASVLQTEEEVFGGPVSTAVLTIPEPIIANVSHLSFVFDYLPHGWSGVDLLVNDVLRDQQFTDGNPLRFDLERGGKILEEIFIRFAWVQSDDFRGLTPGACTKAVTWWRNGTVTFSV